MKRARVSKKAEDWKKILEGWPTSGVSQRRYCEERGIGLSNFHYWRRRLGKPEKQRRKRDLKGGGFITVGPMPLSSAGSPAATLRFPDGAKIELSRMPDPEWVLKVLKS